MIGSVSSLVSTGFLYFFPLWVKVVTLVFCVNSVAIIPVLQKDEPTQRASDLPKAIQQVHSRTGVMNLQ